MNQEERTCCLMCCQSDDPRACIEKEQSNQKLPFEYQRPPRLPGQPDKVHSAATTLFKIEGVRSPRKGIYSSTNTTKASHVSNMHCRLVKDARKNDDCCSRDGVRTGRGSPCVVVLSSYMAASSSLRTRSANCRCCRRHSIPVGSPSPPSQNKFSSQQAVLISKTKILFREGPIRLDATRRRSVALFLRRRSQRPDGAVPSMQA